MYIVSMGPVVPLGVAVFSFRADILAVRKRHVRAKWRMPEVQVTCLPKAPLTFLSRMTQIFRRWEEKLINTLNSEMFQF